jgi:hypothetical protein
METTVTKEVVDLDKLFPGIETDNILTPVTKVPNIFSTDNSLDFLDKPETDVITDEEPKTALTQVNITEADKILDTIGKELSDEIQENVEEVTSGRPKTDKNALASYLKTKIEESVFSPFEDFDEKKETLEEYLSKQPEKVLHQMLDANWENKEKELLERTPVEFFEALPEELQYAARYAMDGGTDMKGLFAALAQVEQVKALDVEDEDGQVAIARTYLQATNFGTPEQINEEIESWKDNNRLEKKARDFKPMLDEMQKEQVEYQLEQQKEWNRQQKEAAQKYTANVHKALEKGELNGLKLDKKTQATLYQGLTTASYPSVSGKPTNLLGHLLDKVQYVEPNFQLLAEATYLLADPEGYKNSIRQQGKNAAITDTVKKLKTEQRTGGDGFEIEEVEQKPKIKKLYKPTNIFAK